MYLTVPNQFPPRGTSDCDNTRKITQPKNKFRPTLASMPIALILHWGLDRLGLCGILGVYWYS